MTILNEYLRGRMQENAAALWLCNCSAAGMPDAVRLMGAHAEPDSDHLILYVPVPLGKDFVNNLSAGGKLAFLFAIVHDNTSFQFKGTCVSYWPSTETEVESQRTYVKAFCRELQQQGLDPERFFFMYFRQPGITVRMRVEEIYEQTPKAGTGGKITAP
jgi:hypothetical protein